jgi:acyl dehydratase
MHSLTAKAFGFPRAIAHGMWTKARCLAALEPALLGAYTVEVEFRKPILLPSRVDFERSGERFRVRSGDKVHLLGLIRE